MAANGEQQQGGVATTPPVTLAGNTNNNSNNSIRGARHSSGDLTADSARVLEEEGTAAGMGRRVVSGDLPRPKATPTGAPKTGSLSDIFVSKSSPRPQAEAPHSDAAATPTRSAMKQDKSPGEAVVAISLEDEGVATPPHLDAEDVI